MNPANRYLQQLTKNHPSGLVRSGASIVHKVGKVVDTIGGFSTGKVKAQADLAKKIATATPNRYTQRVEKNLASRAEDMRRNTRDARVIVGTVGGAAYLANKVGQNRQNDVYSNSYPNY